MATYIGYSTIGINSGNTALVEKQLALRDLMNHFYTRKNERVMNPNFGCVLWDLIFEPLDDYTTNLAVNEVTRIIKSDPRWIFNDLKLEKPNDHTLNIRVQLFYDDTGTAEELYLTYVSEIQ
jgi:phage baseplate assembly protein W